MMGSPFYCFVKSMLYDWLGLSCYGFCWLAVNENPLANLW